MGWGKTQKTQLERENVPQDDSRKKNWIYIYRLKRLRVGIINVGWTGIEIQSQFECHFLYYIQVSQNNSGNFQPYFIKMKSIRLDQKN